MQGSLRKLTLVLLALAALVPAVNIFPWLFPAPWGQAVLVRLLAPLLGLVFLARMLSEPGLAVQALQRLKAARFVLIPLGLFLGIYVLALIFSQDLYFSFWGEPPRAWGALNYFLYLLLGAVAFLGLNKEDWKKLWFWVFAGAAFLVFLAFAQRFGFLPGLIDPTNRPHGTLGNALLLGAYLTSLVFLLLGLAIRARTLQKRQNSLALSLGLLALFALLAVFLTGSRSALLGAGAGAFFFLFFAPVHARLLRIIGLGLATLGIAAFVWLWFNPAPPTFLSPELTGLWERVHPRNLTKTERFAAWSIELKGITERPLLGYGPYNSYIGFNKHFTQEFAEKYSSNGWWDTAHNMYLDVAAGTGLLGLGAFLAFLAALFWALWHSTKAALAQDKILFHGVLAAFVSYVVVMIPAFNSPATYLLFFLLLGYALYLISQTKQMPEDNGRFSQMASVAIRYKSAVIGILAIITIFFVYTAALKPLVVNKKINVALKEAEAGRCESALGRMERSFPEGSYMADWHRLQEAQIIGDCLAAAPQNTLAFSERAVELLRSRTIERPMLPRPWMLLGNYLNNLIFFSQDETQRQALAAEAIAAFQKAKELSFQRAQLYAGWMRTESLLGNQQKVQELAKECLELAPLGSCTWEHLLNRIASGEYSPSFKDVGAETKTYGELGYGIKHESLSFYLRLAQAYTIHKEQHYPQLKDIYERLVALRPDNLQYRASLATVYRELGEPNKAVEQIRKMRRLNPPVEIQRQINAFLQTF